MIFSIVVPVFRVEKYLNQCIESILNQTFQDFELILVDDGSDDCCGAICDAFATNDNRVRVIHKKNEGLVAARIDGARYSTGEYILNIDADDFVANDYLAEMFSIINKFHPDIITTGFMFYFSSPERSVLYKNRIKDGLIDSKKALKKLFYDSEVKGMNDGSFSVSAWTKIVKRDIYIPSQMSVNKSISKGEDSLLTLNLLRNSQQLYVSNYHGYFYRQNNSSMMNKKNQKDFEELALFMNELLPFVSSYLVSPIQLSVCIYHRLYNLLDFYAKSLSLSSFLESSKSIPFELISVTREIKIKRLKLKSRFRLWLVKHKRWSLYYLLFKKQK